MPPRDQPKPSQFAQLIQTAEKLQQRAERARDNAALAAYEQAANAFETALPTAMAHEANGVIEAHFGAGECFQNWADTLLQVLSSLPDAQLSQQVDTDTKSQSAFLYERSVAHYQHVTDPGKAGLRVDAAVNCGNALAAWAEVVPPGEGQMRLLEQAENIYQHALKLEEDAATWSNVADVLIQHAQTLCDSGSLEAATPYFSQAMEAYNRACQLSSSENGDNLPDLLVNWASGLIAAAEHQISPSTAHALLDEAAARLKDSISFNRADPAPFNALGDVWVMKAELFVKHGDPAAAAPTLQDALNEGYGGALRINASLVDALVGCAEAEAVAAKAAGQGEAAGQRWRQAVEWYTRALQQPQSLGSWKERCNVRYNYACSLVGCGRYGEAVGMLKELLGVGAVTMEEIGGDAELAAIRDML